MVTIALTLSLQDTFLVGHHDKFVNITFESEADLETIVGSTNKATGKIVADLEKGSVELSIPVASLKTGIDMRDEHLRSAKWLDAAAHPNLTFESTKVEPVKDKPDQVRVTGEFTMHGVAVEKTIVATWKELPDAAVKKAGFPAGRWIRFNTAFEVKFSDHGIDSAANAAGKVADTVAVKMTIFASTAPLPE